MNTLLRFALATALVTAIATPASAGELHLTMANGHVTLVAKDVTVREILAEWARIGQTQIVNAEKLTGGPVTLELTDVPEAQALDTVLRSAAGYVMAPRMAGSTGTSRYDRIMILATSRPPVVTASNPAPFTSRPMPQLPQNAPADDDADFGPTGANGPVSAQPGMAVMPQPSVPGQPPVQTGQPGQQQPQAPMTAPRPGMLPAPVNPATVPPPNPYLGTPPGPTSPTFNPNPPPPPTTPRGPGGPGGI
jgi:hypothetical protein